MTRLKDLSLSSGSRAALTLVEVVVALVLSASLLVGMIAAFGMHYRQIRRAEQRLQAIAAVEQLLAQWYEGSHSKVPRLGEGLLNGKSTYFWRTVPIERTFIETLPVEVIRLQVFSERTLVDRAEPVVQLDVLLPVKETIP